MEGGVTGSNAPELSQAARFPQLLRTAHHRWWKPLAGVACAVILLITLGIAVVVATMAVVAASGSTENPFSTEALDAGTPLGLLANNLAIAMLAPAVLATAAIVHRQRPGLLASVEGRVRWRFLSRMLLVALALSSTAYVVTLWLPPALPEAGDRPGAGLLVGLLLVVLLTTPLQAAGEEFGFRGYLTQAFASVVRPPGGRCCGRSRGDGHALCAGSWRTGPVVVR